MLHDVKTHVYTDRGTPERHAQLQTADPFRLILHDIKGQIEDLDVGIVVEINSGSIMLTESSRGSKDSAVLESMDGMPVTFWPFCTSTVQVVWRHSVMCRASESHYTVLAHRL